MPAELEPPELARLVDFAERPRAEDWSLRSALVRYSQPQPQRVEKVLDLVRRVEWALHEEAALLARDGQELWSALEKKAGKSEPHVVGVLRVAKELDQLGDVLATWAVEYPAPAPDDEVDRVAADVAARLEALGVPQQERPPGPRNRG